ncbi:MAG: hypothetical protein PHP32_00155 [Candidatus Izemoplasmatales bacterium]|nr:hypothetical protein [Candidatus Izemoplasmatales bacterium]
MENNVQVSYKYTPELAEKFVFFNMYRRKPMTAILVNIFGPFLGLVSLIITIFFTLDIMTLVLGIFLVGYPALIYVSLKSTAKRSVESNEALRKEISFTFLKDRIRENADGVVADVLWSSVFRVYLTKKEIVLYLKANQGVYFLKSDYDSQTLFSMEDAILRGVDPKKIVERR